MTNSLNLYATKVFSEQPIALWALDDTTDYVALISPENQDLSNWDVSGATITDASTEVGTNKLEYSTEPFPGIRVNGIIEEEYDAIGEITLYSPETFQPEDLSAELGSIAFGSYFFAYETGISVTLGMQYKDPTSENPLDFIPVERTQRIEPVVNERLWSFVSHTFSLPENFEDLSFYIKVEYDLTETPYKFIIHGINIGQWAEEFHVESVGAHPAALPANIPLVSNGVPALPYGLEGANGYYISNNNVLYAKNSGLPLVYGAFNSTVILPNTDAPSLIIPGYGVMNQSGQYKNYTVEFWAKIQCNTFEQRRIFGPLTSTDGLYVEGAFLKLKIGNKLGSHYVGEWDRPMLINIRITESLARLVINGEQVFSFELDPLEISFPDKISALGKDQDWLGFYAYPDVPIIQLDCVGIYPYEVPSIVSKRRFVYGQGVEQPDNIKGLNSTNNVFIDFPFSKTTKTYSYPKVGQWSNGIIENLVPNVKSFSLPEYTLPTITFNNKTTQQWYTDIEAEQVDSDYFIKLKPNSSWDSTEGYMFFENFNLLTSETKAFYGIFDLEEITEDQQILFDFLNDTTGNKFSIILNGSDIEYKLTYKNVNGTSSEEIIYSSTGYVIGGKFLVGLHIPRFIEFYGQKVASFFGTKQKIKMFVGGNPSFTNTYKGRFSKIAFCTARNLDKIKDYFTSRGIPTDFENVFDFYSPQVDNDGGNVYFINELNLTGDSTVPGYPDAILPPLSSWSEVFDGGDPFDFPVIDKETHNASYTLVPRLNFGEYILDIGVDSYWEDYLPLSYFGGYVPDSKNEKMFALDFLQLNIDYPKFNVFSDGNFDTTNSPIKTYVSFQYLAAGANTSYSAFSTPVPLPKNGVVSPGTSWLNKKYEVVDDTIIYPPKGVDFNKLSINMHVELNVDGIISNPFNIKSLRISSQALGPSPKRIGTRFGSDIIPYRKTGKSFDYKDVSPFSIYKGSTPYLYNTSNSGIRIRDNYTSYGNRGLSMPINKNVSSFFKLSALQIAIKYDETIFSSSAVQIFELEYADDIIKFYLVADSDSANRGRIFALSQTTGSLKSGISYYLNGRVVRSPIIYSGSWLMLGIAFDDPISFSNFAGAFRVTNPLLFNSFSYYQTTEADEAAQYSFRKWFAVRSEPDNPLDWEYWKTLEGSFPDPEDPTQMLPYRWSEVLFLTETNPVVLDPAKIYKQYTGTDRVVIESGSVFRLSNYQYSTYNQLKWNRQTLDSA